MAIAPDTGWTDDEIVFSHFAPDTDFVFAEMTRRTLAAVDPKPGDRVLDVACGRAIDSAAIARGGARVAGIEASATMIEKALEYLGANPGGVALARSLAERLPFADGAFDTVVCKGAMDHFAELEASMDEMVRVTRPGGKVVIAIANFESLTCRLGRSWSGLKQRLVGTPPPERPFWDPPADHNYKFDRPTLLRLMGRRLRVERLWGVSLLWGLPGWGAALDRVPPEVAAGVLALLDVGARVAPSLADVLVARGERIK